MEKLERNRLLQIEKERKKIEEIENMKFESWVI